MSPDDPRLPGVTLDSSPLRLNSTPLPPDRVAEAQGEHAARLSAAEAWLFAACGSYAPLRQRFVTFWLRFATGHVASHHAELAERLRPFDGLYSPDDFVWSVLRPLPRALLPAGDGVVPVDVAFWNGTQLIAVPLGDAPDIATGSIIQCRVTAADMQRDPNTIVAERFPREFLRFWEGETLPSTPFRRELPKFDAD